MEITKRLLSFSWIFLGRKAKRRNQNKTQDVKNLPKSDQHKEIVVLEMFHLIQSQLWFQLLTKSNFLNLEPEYIPQKPKIVSGKENETEYFT